MYFALNEKNNHGFEISDSAPIWLSDNFKLRKRNRKKSRISEKHTFPKDKVTRKFPPDFRATELCTCVQNVELSARLARFNKVTVPR